jgi:hypothetical protein
MTKKHELNLIKHKDTANIQATNLASTEFLSNCRTATTAAIFHKTRRSRSPTATKKNEFK